MNSKVLVVLALVLVVLIALVVIKQGGQQQPSIIEQAGLVKLAPEGLDAAGVLKLELYQGGKPDQKVTLERENADAPWRVTSHFNAPATADTVGEYLTALLGLQGEKRDEAGSDERLAKYELKDDQAFHVAAYKAGGDTPAYHVLVGKSEGMSTTFVRCAGQSVVYSESTNLRRDAGVYQASEAPTASKWLNKVITKVEEGKEITRLAFTLPDKQLVFERRAKEQPETAAPETGTEQPAPEGNTAEIPASSEAETPAAAGADASKPVEYEWVLASGGPGTPHKDANLQSILSRFKNLTARDVVDPAKKAEYGLDAPQYRTEITIDDGKTVVLEGARPNKTGNGYVRVAGAEQEILYELDSYTFEQVFPKCGQLFDLPKFGDGLKLEDLRRIVIGQTDGSRVVVEKIDGTWKVIEPAVDLKTQDTTLSTLASTLLSWTAADYADTTTDVGPFGQTVTITAGDQTRSFSVAGDSKSIDGMYARIGDAGPVLVMSRTDTKKLLLTPRDVYQLTVLNLVEADVAKLRLRVGEKTLALEKVDETWQTTVDGETRTIETGTVSSLVTRVATFQADDLRLDAAQLEGAPYAAFEITMKDGAAHTLAFGAEQDGEHLMMASGKAFGLSAKKSDLDQISGMIDTILAQLAAPAAPVSPETPATTAAEAAPAATPAVDTTPASVAPETPPVVEAAPSDTAAAEAVLTPPATPLPVETPGAPPADTPAQVQVVPAPVEAPAAPASAPEAPQQ